MIKKTTLTTVGDQEENERGQWVHEARKDVRKEIRMRKISREKGRVYITSHVPREYVCEMYYTGSREATGLETRIKRRM
jgi:hypothetical protein